MADNHIHFLQLALQEAQKCIPTPTAFCVGCVLVTRWPNSELVVLSTGYSRELPGNTHAEANALAKARSLPRSELQQLIPSLSDDIGIEQILAKTDIYTTMEPCSVRTSGLAPCSAAIVTAGLHACYIGVGEPDDFVKCEGALQLQTARVEVYWITGLEKECLEVARTGH